MSRREHRECLYPRDETLKICQATTTPGHNFGKNTHVAGGCILVLPTKGIWDRPRLGFDKIPPCGFYENFTGMHIRLLEI